MEGCTHAANGVPSMTRPLLFRVPKKTQPFIWKSEVPEKKAADDHIPRSVKE